MIEELTPMQCFRERINCWERYAIKLLFDDFEMASEFWIQNRSDRYFSRKYIHMLCIVKKYEEAKYRLRIYLRFEFCTKIKGADILGSEMPWWIQLVPNKLTWSQNPFETNNTSIRTRANPATQHPTLPAIRIENNHKPCRNLLIIPSGTTSSSAMTKRMSTPTSTESLGFAWSIDQEWKERNTKRRTRNASIVRYVNDIVFNSVTIDGPGELFVALANAVCI